MNAPQIKCTSAGVHNLLQPSIEILCARGHKLWRACISKNSLSTTVLRCLVGRRLWPNRRVEAGYRLSVWKKNINNAKTKSFEVTGVR